jgi:flagellar hook assembly protein FlgD
LTNGQTYKFKVASIFNPGPGEIYLESNTLELSLAGNGNEEETTPAVSNLTNFPNPLNAETSIEFKLHHASKVELSILNIKGQQVRTLPEEVSEPADYLVTWDGTDENNEKLASGIYFCCIKTDKVTQLRKMVLLK